MTVRRVRLFPPSRFGPLGRILAAAAIATLIAWLPTPSAAAGAGAVTGRIVDAETGEPVSDVQVELIAGGRNRVASAISDAQGQWVMTAAPTGSFSLVFSRLGYEIRRLDGILLGAEPADVGAVRLVSRALRMNPIVVTPSRTEEKALRAPASTWVVSHRDIEARPATTAVDHVRSVPGMDVASSGLTQNLLVARGFNNVFSGTLFVLTDNRWASVPSLRFNAYNMIPATDEDIDHIELVLGPGSALYGPNVTNGAMHIITRSPLAEPGTTFSALAGEREVAQVSGRHARRIGRRVGFKVSGSYFRGRDWVTRDPFEESARTAAIAAGADADTLRIGARDFDAERFSGEGRLDVRLGERTDLIASGGFSQLGSSIELTGIGAAQARDWRYSYTQLRLRRGALFAQGYVNFSDAGNTYLLRDGSRLRDNSLLYVGQVQHAAGLGERQRFIYGIDLIRTVPRTGGTLTGRNENDDDITELGGYLQSETRLRPKLDFVTAARLDHHSRVDESVLSPRAAIVIRPADGHSLRLTYNRAFNQPSSNSLFLDLRSAQDLGGLPFDVRVTGVPRDGFQFRRDVGGRPLMRSPFTPAGLGGPAQQLPLDATVFWNVVVQILQSRGTDISAIPAPNGNQVGTVMRSLNATTRAFDDVSDVADFAPLRPQIDNTVETGYKGLIANRLSLGLDLYYSRVENFTSPLLVATPSVFLDRASLEAYLSNYMSPVQAAQIAAAVSGIAGNPAATGIPLGTVTPVNTVGDPYDIFFTYRNFGTVDLWGADLGATFLATDQLSFTGTYSFVNRNLYRKRDGVADIALNAPMNKATLSANYRNARMGLAVELRGRYVDHFPMSSGVYVGAVASYALMDVNVSYALPFARRTEVALAGTNVFDDRHRELVGAPELGRLVLVRVRQSF
ncbi:MAG: TonB-dependent receptor [Candidatus Eisenbacteria bacterium]|uniref:TonB-dependent receptor n=1 Tax=Eiseniibacteriota bacterium TaxID=2212470 RepID=A0A538UDR4_UNCEI|nr:MAG: TonB-dependent receptor [Candidatus Eisenbacteria bacterium]